MSFIYGKERDAYIFATVYIKKEIINDIVLILNWNLWKMIFLDSHRKEFYILW